MKKIKILLAIILISSGFLSKTVVADTIYVDLDTVIEYQKIIVCETDTLNIFHSSYPNPIGWAQYDIGESFDGSPYIIITKNDMKYLNDNSEWITWMGETNGKWQITGSFTYLRLFYTYFTTPLTEEPWAEDERAICGTQDTLYANPDSYQDGVYFKWENITTSTILTEG